MPFNGSGIFSIVNTFVPGTSISSADVNANFSDIASGLSDVLTRDGQAGMTAPLKVINGNTSTPSLTFASEPTLGLYRAATATLGVSGSLSTTGGLAVAGKITQGGNPLLPIGLGPLPWSGLTAPTLWVFARGQSLLRATYPDLWTFASNEIANGNTLYTNGDGSTTFTVADLSGGTTFGFDNSTGRLTTANSGVDGATLGAVGGIPNPTILTANLPPYTPSGSITTVNSQNGNATLQFPDQGGPIKAAVGGSASGSSLAQPMALTSQFFGVAQGGTSTPIKTQPRTVVTNYIIFAGA